MGGVRMVPRLAACGLALAALILIVGGVVFDRIAAAKDVPGSGAWWLYPFLLAAVLAPAVVGVLIAVQRPANPIGWILVLGALSLAACDRILICENAIFSVIPPEAAAAILKRDDVDRVAQELKPTAKDLIELRKNLIFVSHV